MHEVIGTAATATVSTETAKKLALIRCLSNGSYAINDSNNAPITNRRKTLPVSKSLTFGKRIDSWTKRCFVAQFASPSRHLTADQELSLKSYHVTRWSIYGVVVVRSTDMENHHVYVRYTLDDWKSFQDVEATFLDKDTDNEEDIYQFRLDFPFRLPVGTRLEFAIACESLDGEKVLRWDNNDEANYVFVYSDLEQ